MLRLPITIALTALLSTAALAQTPQTAKPTMRDRIAAMKDHMAAKAPSGSKVAATKPPKPGMAQTQQPRTAKSLACSTSADSKGLHGKPRKSFMEKCKRT